jgi:hypothetical protein
MTDLARDRSAAFDAAPPWRLDLSNALLLVSALLLGIYFVLRAVSFQWSPYTPDTALASLVAILFVLGVWGLGRVWAARRSALPEGLVAALVLWLGLNALGLFRSENWGAGLPRATEVGLDVLLLGAAYALARAWPPLVPAVARLLVALGVFEGALGYFQLHWELPRLREMAAAHAVTLPDVLTTQMGYERLMSPEIFGTFGNANSYAALLLVSIFVQLGLWRDQWSRRSGTGWPATLRSDLGHLLCLAVQGYGLSRSGSKGAWVACVFGLWVLGAQALATTPLRARAVKWLTVAGLAAGVLVLVLGTAGVLPKGCLGESMEVRFGYWRTAWAMLHTDPLLGLGLGTFSDAYANFKGPDATETLLAHNDWLQLAAELGVVGPLAWGLLWYLVLRGSPPVSASASPSALPAPESASDVNLARTNVLAWLLVGGGILGFAFLYVGFGRLSAPDLWALPETLAQQKTADGVPPPPGLQYAIAGAVAAVLTPLIFAAGFFLVRPERGARAAETGHGLRWGFRAAVAAVLLHEVVDFDMTAQMVMAALFVIGGFLVALRASSLPTPDGTPATGPLARTAGWLCPVLAVVLIPGAVVIPLMSGLGRENAEADEHLLRQVEDPTFRARLPNEEYQETRKEVLEQRKGTVRARQQAFEWAPFDGQAAFELALSYVTLRRVVREDRIALDGGGPQSLTSLTLERLEDARRLRPRWANAPLVLGHAWFDGGWTARENGERTKAETCFANAVRAYREAVRLYPCAPSFRLAVGDALLSAGDPVQAAAWYRAGWETDRAIQDRNVRFASIFHDPAPGCLVKHGRDQEVQSLLKEELKKSECTGETRQGLLIRQLLTSAWGLERARHKSGGDLLAIRVSEMNVVASCEALANALPEDGHAQLFFAAALAALRPRKDQPSRDIWQAELTWPLFREVLPLDTAWSVALADAITRSQIRQGGVWRRALELQENSVKQGHPDTSPVVFEELRALLKLR